MEAAFPSVSTLKEELNATEMDFGLNMILGVILGGTQVGMDLGLNSGETRWLFIMPAERDGQLFGVLIYIAIIFVMMMVPVARTIREARLSGQLPQLDKPDAFFSRLPDNPRLYALVWLIPAYAFSFLFIWGVMTIMEFEVLNFFQYFFIRLSCTKLLTRVFAALCVMRFIQPDSKA